jgi:hypothetical protein
LTRLNNNNNDDDTTTGANNNNNNNQKIAVEYRTLISCIDFGNQLGSFLPGPIVAMLGISRENNFEHLDCMIFLCSWTSILLFGLLVLLRKN